MYMWSYVIHETQSAQNLTEARWAKYICNHEKNVPSRLSPQWLCGNSFTWAHDVWFINHQVHELPQSHCDDTRRAHFFHDCINMYMCIYIGWKRWNGDNTSNWCHSTTDASYFRSYVETKNNESERWWFPVAVLCMSWM